MSAWKYKRIMPETIVAKLKLIDHKDLLDLAGRSIEYIHSTLTNTPYKTEILAIPEEQLCSISIENALLKNYLTTFEEIVGHSPKDIGSLLSTVMMKFEADNVKTVLRIKGSKISYDEAFRYIVPVGRLDVVRCQKILGDSESIDDVVELLSDLEYGSVLENASKEHKEIGFLLSLETALDKYIYGEIWRATGKLRGLDKTIARTVLSIEIDSLNLKVILRCKEIGIEKDQIRHYLIPVTDIFGEKELEDAIKARDIRSSIESLLIASKLEMARDHQYLLIDLLKAYDTSQSLLSLEMVLDRGLLKTSLKMLKEYTPFFNVGLILAFLNLKWFELRNLRAIVKGAENNIPSDKIKKLLILPE